MTDVAGGADTPASHHRGRAGQRLAVLAGAAATGGLLLITAAATQWQTRSVIATDVSPAVAAGPTTLPPLIPLPAPTVVGTPSSATVDDVADAPPISELLPPRESAHIEPVVPRIQPVAILSDTIDLSRFPIRPVGLEADGSLEIPDETEIGWYRYGAAPGESGATVLAAHVSWNRTTGPFYFLGQLEPGDRIELTLENADVRTYEVVERTMYLKDELPVERIWRRTGDEALVLITCGGDFNPEIRRYRHNVVVYAAPVG